MNPVRSARLKAGIRMSLLADTIGYSRTYMSLVESGKLKPSVLAILKIAKFLGCDPTPIYSYYKVLPKSFIERASGNPELFIRLGNFSDEELRGILLKLESGSSGS